MCSSDLHIPECRKVFRAELIDDAFSGRPESPFDGVFVDSGTIGPCVRIRNWKPGDYYRPVGLSSGKLKKLFQKARIPRSLRNRWPVVVSGSSVVWVASFPVSREFAPCGKSRKVVAIDERPD